MELPNMFKKTNDGFKSTNFVIEGFISNELRFTFKDDLWEVRQSIVVIPCRFAKFSTTRNGPPLTFLVLARSTLYALSAITTYGM